MSYFINITRFFFLRIYYWVCSLPGYVTGWFSQPEIPLDEFVRLALENKSWFDKISSGWMEQSFWVKASAITGITLLAGLIGLAVGASLLFGLSALALGIGIHLLLDAHETNRVKHAKLFFETSIALNADLEANIQLV